MQQIVVEDIDTGTLEEIAADASYEDELKHFDERSDIYKTKIDAIDTAIKDYHKQFSKAVKRAEKRVKKKVKRLKKLRKEFESRGLQSRVEQIDADLSNVKKQRQQYIVDTLQNNNVTLADALETYYNDGKADTFIGSEQYQNALLTLANANEKEKATVTNYITRSAELSDNICGIKPRKEIEFFSYGDGWGDEGIMTYLASHPFTGGAGAVTYILAATNPGILASVGVGIAAFFAPTAFAAAYTGVRTYFEARRTKKQNKKAWAALRKETITELTRNYFDNENRAD